MARTGDKFFVVLTPSQLGWGDERYTGTRAIRHGEGYLAIHKEYAITYGLFNSNHTGGADILGENIFNCTSADGFLNCQLKAQGCSEAGDEYAKQFAVNDDLRGLGNWYTHTHANIGDRVEVLFLSPTDIQLTLL